MTFFDKDLYLFRRLVVGSPSVMRCHKNRDVRSLGKDYVSFDVSKT